MKTTRFSLLMICIFTSLDFPGLAQAGTPDSTFGNNGIVITKLKGSDESMRDVAVQPDCKIVIGICGY